MHRQNLRAASLRLKRHSLFSVINANDMSPEIECRSTLPRYNQSFVVSMHGAERAIVTKTVTFQK